MNMTAATQTADDAYFARIAAIHHELGIPASYAARGLPLCREAGTLTDIGPDISQRPRQLTPPAAAAWQAMRDKAQQEHVSLLVVSAFRSVAHQQELIARKLARGETLDSILRVLAAPGYSEHHTGRALDLTTTGIAPLETAFEDSAEFAWLERHASAFGFHLSYPRDNPHGIMYEPWHWAYADS